jgi:hypothetical protein
MVQKRTDGKRMYRRECVIDNWKSRMKFCKETAYQLDRNRKGTLRTSRPLSENRRAQ